MELLKRVLAWAKRNERHLGAIVFLFGFITDLFTFTLLSVSLVNLAFLGYLALAAISTLGSHYFSATREHAAVWRRALAVIFPLAAQYAIGSLLSGCLIYYTKSSAFLVSWPFLLLLCLVFIGNEYFRTYYKHLAFQVLLLFFAIYAYAIFAFPLLVHTLGPWIFAGSTVLALLAFALFLYVLNRIHTAGFVRSLGYVIPGTVCIVALMNICYFTGLVPPIPLTLPVSGIYHSVAHEGGHYVLTTEGDRAWWDLRPLTVHHVPGTPLYAFTSVSAPVEFGAAIVHVWERYDTVNKRWVDRNHVAFPISGGRDGGYRGYSQVYDPEGGKWRVTIETTDGQVIGRTYFTIETVETAPSVVEETR